MQITKVEPILVALPYEHGAPKPARHGIGSWATQDILFVRVDTDVGLTGWGEAFSNASSPATVPAISEIVAKLAVGRDATDIDTLMLDLTRRTQSMARSGPVSFALSGLEIALWDLAGKAVGAPLWRLLGGEPRTSVSAYASLFRVGSPELVARVAREAAHRGYRHIKLHEHSVEAVAAARAAIGPDIGLMVDVNCFWTSGEDVVAFCKAVEPFNLAWLEEPLFPVDSYDETARVRACVRAPIAAGENLGTYNDLRWMIDAGAVDVAQPSVAKIGGIGPLRRAIAYAQAHGVRAVPHSPYVGPALVATVHVIAAMKDPPICEHRFCDLEASPIGACVMSRAGSLPVPMGPGLGFEVDLDLIERFRAPLSRA